MLLILVISIVALVLTSSYALFSFEEKGKIENKLVTGTVKGILKEHILWMEEN